ncbi:MAG: M23 family metallopeptidase [Rhodothermales bacterium]|nr:M23 family metallopeptidase [Rhodothermales bacterium]
MTSFLLDLLRGGGRSRTVLVVDESGVEHPRQYEVDPRHFYGWVGAGAGALALLVVLVLLVTPARRLVFGPDPDVLRERARLNAIRASALEDSLAAQGEYLRQLRTAIVGEPDTAEVEPMDAAPPAPAEAPAPAEDRLRPRSDDWADHEQPALSLTRLVADGGAAASPVAEAYLASLQFPALPPVEGFFARGFEAARGHYAVDFAVEEQTPVRAIGDGYVVFADWTNDGGYVVAVQHADGYLSVYKHNSRLLKRVGDRVRSREAVALSGNTGEVTTGPHLHFELWRNGLAQDPRLYLIGL